MSKLRPFRLTFNSIRVQLILWIALPVAVSLLGMSMVEIRGHEGAMTQLVQQQADLVARSLEAVIDAEIIERQSALQEWAGHYTAGAVPPASVQHAFGAGTVVFPLVESNSAPSWATIKVMASFIDNVNNQQKPSSTTVYDESAARWLFVHAVPSGNTPLVIASAEAITEIIASELMATLDPSQLDQVQITLPSGELLYANSVTDHSPTDAEHIGHDAARWVSGQSVVATTGWQITVLKDWRDLVPPLLNFGNVALIIMVVAIILSLLSAYFGLRTIVWPLQRLNQEVSQVGWGDFLAIKQPVGGVVEIEELRYVLARMTEQIRQYQNELQSYIGAMTLGQEEERRRLARELHDETVQNLIALNHQVEMVERELARDPQVAAKRLQTLRPLVTATIDDLRRQIYALRPLYLEDLGFVPALEMLIKQVCQRNNLTSNFVVTGMDEPPLAIPVQISAYRITQEALQNVVKHAHASRVIVAIHFDEESLTLRITDNGSGFSVPDRSQFLAQEGHFGLLGIKERAQLHGGTLKIESQPGEGTTILVQLPYQEINESLSALTQR